MKRFRVTGKYEADGKPVSLVIPAEDENGCRDRAATEGLCVDEVRLVSGDPAVSLSPALCKTVRSAEALVWGGMTIVLLSPAAQQQQFHEAIVVLMYFGGAAMVIGSHYMLRLTIWRQATSQHHCAHVDQ